ncbi:MAG: hypothetical protein ACPGWR_20835, partial [Ardenticatenaceae bacterium]
FYPIRTSIPACSTQSEQAFLRVLPNPNKHSCVFYPIRTSIPACSTQSEQAGMRVLRIQTSRDACYTKVYPLLRNTQYTIRNTR